MDMLVRKSVDLCYVQKMIKKGRECEMVEGRADVNGGVGVLVAEKLVNQVMDINRVNERILVVKLLLRKRVVSSQHMPLWTRDPSQRRMRFET